MSIKEGLLAITNEVLGDVQKEAQALILAAENEAKETLKAAKEQADKNYLAIINDAQVKAEGDARKIVSVTEVETRNFLLHAKEDLIDAAFSKAQAKLKSYVATERYCDYLLTLIEDVAKHFGQKSLIVQVNDKDKKWLTQHILKILSKKLHMELKLSKQTGDFLGGFQIQTVDGEISYDSRLDNRLEELKSSLRVTAAKTLFSKEA